MANRREKAHYIVCQHTEVNLESRNVRRCHGMLKGHNGKHNMSVVDRLSQESVDRLKAQLAAKKHAQECEGCALCSG